MMMTRHGTIKALLFTLALSLGAPVLAASTLDMVKSRGKVLLGVKTDYPPFASLDATQNYVGFDIDLWQRFAKDLGVTIEYVPITSQSRIPSLLSGAIDVVSGGTTHTLSRDKTVDFSVTYFVTGQRLLVRKGSGIKGPEDLKSPKATAVVQGANSGAQFMKIQAQGKLTTFQEYPQAVIALKQSKVDAVTSDDVLLAQFTHDNPDLEVVGEFMTRENYGMVVREDDSKWRDWINAEIQGAWKSGLYQTLYAKYFGGTPAFTLELWQD
jgi:polar amino acid transport system substrate-binding protein